MNEVFLDYAKYYDALYKDKDYEKEAEFIHGLLKKFAPSAKEILNIGCGTGEHDKYLAELGYSVVGIDLSNEMIKIAKEKNNSDRCEFIHGDARSLKLDKKFDAVISLFHVFSYQTSNEDVTSYLNSLQTLLKDGGVAIFDYWYGPAVLSIKPEDRTKKLESHDMVINRKASTEINYISNVATVYLNITIEDKISGSIREIKENHPMRYFFSPEIKLFTKATSLKIQHHAAWMSESTLPSNETWSVYTVLKK